MKTFAFILNGLALDPVQAADATAARKLFSPALLAIWDASGRVLSEVPADTRHGAAFDGSEVVNPPDEVAADPVYRDLTDAAFMVHCRDNLGGGLEGAARYEAIFAAGKASTETGMTFAMQLFDKADAVEYAEAVPAFDLFLALGIGGITQAERDNIIDNWPTV